jgi:predicted small lipoprotein YifL
MTKRYTTLLIGLGLAVVAACGRKGPLELPPGRAPMAVERLSAVWKDGAVVLDWANPAKTVSGHVLDALREAEIWVFEGDAASIGSSLDPGAVEKAARRAGRLAVAPAAASTFVFQPPPSGPASLAFTVRVFDRKGRASAFSAPAVVDIVRKKGGRA